MKEVSDRPSPLVSCMSANPRVRSVRPRSSEPVRTHFDGGIHRLVLAVRARYCRSKTGTAHQIPQGSGGRQPFREAEGETHMDRALHMGTAHARGAAALV